MSAETEKMLSNALNVFNAKLSDRQVIKLEGMEDYLKVPQYKTLVNLEKQASQLETDAAVRIMNSKIAYLKAVQELRTCEMRWFQEIRNGMDALEERDRLVKEVNMKMRKGDYSMLQPAAPAAADAASEPRPSLRKAAAAAKPPMYRRPEPERPVPPLLPTAKPEISDLKKRLAMINMNDTPTMRQPLTSININKSVEITSTPKICSMLSSKGSLDGSLVPNRAPTSPLNPAKWDVPAPNFDETIDIDTEPINPRLRGKPTSPSALLDSPPPAEEEDNQAEDTFPLVQPSLPFQTPTVPKSRPFLLSSMRKESSKGAADDVVPSSTKLPPRPVPTPVRPSSSSSSSDPLSSLGLMKLKRPVLNSEVGKKLMGQL